MNDNLEPFLDDPRVVAALEEYQEALEAGRKPNRELFLARHADVGAALAECLDGLEALHGSMTARPPSPEPEASLGEPLGDFRLVREVGRGGMGIVYEAEQMSLGRRVALKVLPFAAALDARQLQRFKNEAQAAAHLHHPHIVPVYGVGAERGVHYYAMQLIEGQNLAALVQELRHGTSPKDSTSAVRLASDQTTGPYPSPSQAAADTRTEMGTQLTSLRTSKASSFFRTIARLTVQAAEALDYAHGVGVVHRDIKPANLLVDGRGDVWITDFGLAQFQTDAGLTQTGDLLGTLRYMSPEQAGGQRVLIDHRTDVYSLGATLYELLTLRPIFDGADRQSLLNQILHEEPKPPRSVDRSIPEELETIVLKATAKAPADRYVSAGDLAADLHRYLRHEPIQARRPTLLQRARKWLRRHPAVPVVGGFVLSLLTAGSLLGAWVIAGEQEKTRLAYEAERRRAEEAENQFQLARRSVDDLIRIAEDHMADNPHLQSLRKLMLESALEYYEEFLDQRRADPAAQPQLEATRAHVMQILDDLAVIQGAGQVSLFTEKEVLDDLKLTEEQRARLADISDRVAKKRHQSFEGRFGKLPEDERRKRFQDLARANEEAFTDVRGFLSVEQLVRLKQIALQRQGPGAFREADVIAALKLTIVQRERIRAIEADTFFGRPDGPRGGPPPGKPPEQAMKEAMQKIQDLLTEDQAKRWKEMTGAPFKAAFKPPGPQGGRPPR